MKKILLYIILFLSGIDGAWALPIEKEGMSIYSPSLKQEVSYSIILPEGYVIIPVGSNTATLPV